MNRTAPLVFTVSELNRHIRDALEPLYADIWVEGELSNFRAPSSGHWYFTLKDSGTQIRAVMFRSARQLVRFAPEDGLQVVCRGRITVYEPRGEYQVVVGAMEPKGLGALQLAFEQLKQRLHQEGLFDSRHKKALPRVPARIVVITSPTGAAVRDILQVIHRRFPHVGILVIPVSVQGDSAPGEIAAALHLASAQGLGDVVILGRGGGSLEDLAAFNTECVARAIFASRLPVLSAVGHEIDVTIADFVADQRAPTPSAAAELVVPDQRELRRHLQILTNGLYSHMRQCTGHRVARLASLRATLPAPRRLLTALQLRHGEAHARLVHAPAHLLQVRRHALRSAGALLAAGAPHNRIAEARARANAAHKSLLHNLVLHKNRQYGILQTLSGRLNALSPLQVLARGYSITRRLPSREPVTEATSLSPGDFVSIRFYRGAARCTVTEIIDAE